MISSVEVQQLILCICDGKNHDHINRNTVLLNEYINEHVAWDAIVHLLSHSISEINENLALTGQQMQIRMQHYSMNYFLSNMLLFKIKKHWNTLSNNEKQSILELVQSLIQNELQMYAQNTTANATSGVPVLGTSTKAVDNQKSIYLKRLMLCYVHVCMYVVHGLQNLYVPSCTALLYSLFNDANAFNPNASTLNCKNLSISIHMLSILPVELQATDMDSATKNEIILNLTSDAIKLVVFQDMSFQLYTTLIKPILDTGMINTIYMMNPSDSCSIALIDELETKIELYLNIMRLLKHWIPLFGHSLSTIYKQYSFVFEMVASTFQLYGQWCKQQHNPSAHIVPENTNVGDGILDCLSEAMMLLLELIEVSEYPTPSDRSLILDAIVDMFLNHWDVLSVLVYISPSNRHYMLSALQQMSDSAQNNNGSSGAHSSHLTHMKACVDFLKNQHTFYCHTDNFPNEFQKKAAIAITECICGLIANDAEYLSTDVTLAASSMSTATSSPVGINELHLRLYVLLCLLTLQTPSTIAMSTFDAWACLQDIPTDCRIEYLKSSIYQLLYGILLQQQTYPIVDPSSSHYSPSAWTRTLELDLDEGIDGFDMMEALAEFREHENGIKDLCIVCNYAIGYEHCFRIFGAHMIQCESSVDCGIVGIDAKWNTVEVCVHNAVTLIALAASKDNCGGLTPLVHELCLRTLSFLERMGKEGHGGMMESKALFALNKSVCRLYNVCMYAFAITDQTLTGNCTDVVLSIHSLRLMLLGPMSTYLLSQLHLPKQYSDTNAQTSSVHTETNQLIAKTLVTASHKIRINNRVNDDCQEAQALLEFLQALYRTCCVVFETHPSFYIRADASVNDGGMGVVSALAHLQSQMSGYLEQSGACGHKNNRGGSVFSNAIEGSLVTTFIQLCHSCNAESSSLVLNKLLELSHAVLTEVEISGQGGLSDDRTFPFKLCSLVHWSQCIVAVFQAHSICNGDDASANSVQDLYNQAAISDMCGGYLARLSGAVAKLCTINSVAGVVSSTMGVELQCAALLSGSLHTLYRYITDGITLQLTHTIQLEHNAISNASPDSSYVLRHLLGIPGNFTHLAQPQTQYSIYHMCEAVISTLDELHSTHTAAAGSTTSMDTKQSQLLISRGAIAVAGSQSLIHLLILQYNQILLATPASVHVPGSSSGTISGEHWRELKERCANYVIALGYRVIRFLTGLCVEEGRVRLSVPNAEVVVFCQFVETYISECSNLMMSCLPVEPNFASTQEQVELHRACLTVVTSIPSILVYFLKTYCVGNHDYAHSMCKQVLDTISLLFHPSDATDVNGILRTVQTHPFWLHIMFTIAVPVGTNTETNQTTPSTQLLARIVLEGLLHIVCCTDGRGGVTVGLPSTCRSILCETFFSIIKGSHTDFVSDMNSNTIVAGTAPPPVWYQEKGAICMNLLLELFAQQAQVTASSQPLPSSVGINAIEPHMRRLILQKLYELCLAKDNKKMFRVIFIDLMKVCNGEVSLDILTDHML